MFKFKFLGKTRIPHRKNTTDMPAIKMALPKEVLLPVEQHIGTPATVAVKVGDEVKVGQLVAEAACTFSSPIYASVSGKVTKIEKYLRSNGKSVDAIRIESDGLMTPYEELTPPTVTDLDSFIDAVYRSGVVGLGGAGFPTAAKLEGAKKNVVHTIILNGAECEPYITSDARTMIDDANLVFDGVSIIKRVMPDVNRFIIAIESNKPECIAKMNETFKDDELVTVKELPSLYPQGAEKVLIYNTTKTTVPAGKFPADVGIIVMNVTTVAKIANYIKTGMPLVEKRITVDGSAIENPKNLFVPIGTSIRDILDFVGVKDGLKKVIIGGPMTGFAASSLDEPIIKTTGALIACTEEGSRHLKTTACIHCGKCIDACPHLLSPTSFTKALAIDNEEERIKRLEYLNVSLCVECGCCSYVCPANRPLMENNRVAKNALKNYKAAKKDLK